MHDVFAGHVNIYYNIKYAILILSFDDERLFSAAAI